MDSGHLIGHLINIDGKFMSFVEFKIECPAIAKTNFPTYEEVLKALREYQRAKEIVLINSM